MMVWQSAREPGCVHSDYDDGSGLRQPASACSICKDGPELAAWKAYWADPANQHRIPAHLRDLPQGTPSERERGDV